MNIELLIILVPLALFVLAEIKNNFGEPEGDSPEKLREKKESGERSKKLLRLTQEHETASDELTAFKKRK